jgi:hypothetical protein
MPGNSEGGDNSTEGNRASEGDATPSAGSDHDNAQYLLDDAEANLESDEEYLPSSTIGHTSTGNCFQVLEQANRLSGNILLLDSCSSVNLVCNSALLHDITTVDWSMRVRCNAGVRSTNQQGRLGNFPEPVWYNPKGVANILSLNSVKKYYKVTYDSNEGDAFIVTDDQGLKLHFTPTKNGLYALRGHGQDWSFVNTVSAKAMRGPSSRVSFLNTVSENKDVYTKRELKAASRARTVQNIMMFPSTRQLLDISDRHFLRNNPVQRADIQAAENIYGTNLGALQGKTMTRKGITVDGQITGVPPAIKSKYQSGTLCIDLMFVNKIPFMLTTSRGLHFGTVENLSNRKATTISKALNKVLS